MRIMLALLLFVFLCVSAVGDEAKPLPESAAWELKAMGAMEPGVFEKITGISGKRRVRLGIVGTGGVSRKLLERFLSPELTISYKLAPDMANPDPTSGTHDTGQAEVILDLLAALKVPTDVLIYQENDEPKAWAEAFALAGSQCDIVVFFQSYWDEIQPTLGAIRKSPALFLCPYGEVGDKATSTAVQGYSAKPWMCDSIPNLLTCAPLAKKGGGILIPLDRPELDTEIVNIIAPSYHASGSGGTCPSAAVAAAVACYTFSAARSRPNAGQIARTLRRSCIIDHKLLAGIPEVGEKGATELERTIRAMTNPPKGKLRTLDAPGILNLRALYGRLRP